MKTKILEKGIIEVKGKKREFTLRMVRKNYFIFCDRNGLVRYQYEDKEIAINEFKKIIKGAKDVNNLIKKKNGKPNSNK